LTFRYILVANFGENESKLSSVAHMYSSGELLVDTSGNGSDDVGNSVNIKELVLAPGHAFVLKLPI